MAEEFTLKERFWDSPTVDRHKGATFPIDLLMNSPSHKLLAGSCFAGDKDIHIDRQKVADWFIYRKYAGVETDQLSKAVIPAYLLK